MLEDSTEYAPACFFKDFIEELDAEIGLFSNGGRAGFQEFSDFGGKYWGECTQN